MNNDDLYNQAVHECFMGDVQRDCMQCMASPDHGGKCCFGQAYNPIDKECRDCLHRSECSSQYHGVPSSRINIRRPIPQYSYQQPIRRVPVTPVVNTHSAVRQTTNLIPTAVHRTPPSIQKEELVIEPFMKRLGRVTGWGMVEGGLQMALNFFQRNRPE
jgi:hypothetical protein